MNNAPKKTCLLIILISCVSFAQDLTLANSVSLNILSNTEFYVNGLSLNPSSNFSINGTNVISRNSTAIAPQAINRVISANNVLSGFQGTMSFFYDDSELNGVNESDLVLQLRDGSGVWSSFSGTLDTNNNTLVYNFGSPINFNAVTASANGVTLYTNSINKLDINVFPNPVTTSINIATNLDVNVSVYNAVGQKVLRTNKKTIDLSSFLNGVYIFEVTDIKTQASNSYKVVKN